MLLDFLFPKFCVGCNSYGKYICNTCKSSLEYVTQKDKTHIILPEYIDDVFSVVRYNAFAKKVITTIKYKLAYAIFDEIQNLLLEQKEPPFQELKAPGQTFIIQPIPLHANRYKKRGFNQSKLFADMFSKLLHHPCVDVLERVLDTAPQASLNKAGRNSNMENAFSVKKPDEVKKANVILVDDVFTTGSTCNEAARALKKQGADNIYACTFALD